MVATNGQMNPAQAEEFMAKRMGAEVRKIASSHAVMVSHPKDAADLIALAADFNRGVGEFGARFRII